MAIEGVQLWEDGPVYAKEPIYYEDNKDDGAVFLVGTETDPTGETMYLDYNESSFVKGKLQYIIHLLRATEKTHEHIENIKVP